ncbi:hypothetical protein CARUB_v10006662mg [Capsella rubella]|uniref:Late embryogenesis abundant protein LEA-2 subgroup domain-containing protein n=1 Tax=Capsella rubella TaxID=81985 RepID=R0H3S4_9BRAS|nr:hypothetical protein CARUB_v10006662mg [Capsella rubella]
MEEPRLPPTNNENNTTDPPSTCHRPTGSLPQLPSSPSQVSSPPQHLRNHSLNLSTHLSSSSPPPPDPIPEIETYVVQPEPPVFNVNKLERSRHFEIMLTSKNPTSTMWVTYKGLVSLMYKNKNLGQGNFPELSLAVSGSHTVNLELEGSKNAAVLPPEVVSLVLTMGLNAGFGTGLVKRDKEVVVTCDIKVKGLLNDAHNVEIVSESCESQFTK